MTAIRDLDPGAAGQRLDARRHRRLDARTKLAHVSEWPGPDLGGPDCASVNWHEDGALDVATALRDSGIGVEAGIWTPRATIAFVSTNWPWQVERVLVEVIPGVTPAASTGRGRPSASSPRWG